ncbi:hypothetical protein KAT92_04500 [Candidatus Babeliales bacterium]|nr:hypothetical protein [Candidatus Babeliales bacterium]
MEEEYKNKLIETIKGYKCLERVDGADKNDLITLMYELTIFDPDHPNLEFSVMPCPGFYILSVKAWTSAIDVAVFYHKFLGESRKQNVTNVISTQCIPSPDSEVGPLLKIRVARSNFGTQPKRKAPQGHKRRALRHKKKKKKTRKSRQFQM